MKNITISMEDAVASWTRVAAAKREQSVSRFVGELLRERMEADEAYERAMQAFLTTPPTAGGAGRALPSREERHDRAGLRR